MRKLLAATALTAAVLLVAAPAGADRAGDQEIADETVLTLDDLPDGWEEVGVTDDELSRLPECKRIDAAAKRSDKAPHADSPEFGDVEDPNGVTTISSRVTVFPKVKGAKRYLAPYQAVGEECLEALAAEGPDVTDIDIEPIDLDGFGDDAVGWTVYLTIDDGGEEVLLVTDLVAVRVGRGIVTIVALGLDATPDEGPDVLELLVERLGDEL